MWHLVIGSDQIEFNSYISSGGWVCQGMRLLWLEVKWPPVPWVLDLRYNLAKLICRLYTIAMWRTYICMFLNSDQCLLRLLKSIFPTKEVEWNFELFQFWTRTHIYVTTIYSSQQRCWLFTNMIDIQCLTVVIYAQKPPDDELKFYLAPDAC